MTDTALRADNAEMAFIGCVIRRGSVPNDVTGLAADSFFIPDARRAFEACQRLTAEKVPIELITVVEEIEAQYGTGAANHSFLLDCLHSMPSAIMAPTYAKIIQEASARRRLYDMAVGLQRDAQDPASDLLALADEAKGKLKSVALGGSRWLLGAEVMLRAYEDLEQRSQGLIKPIVSGIESLDLLTGGFFPGELTIIGARPAVGKSAFALQIATSGAIISERQTCFASAEMADVQIGQRMLANAAKIRGQRLRTGTVSDEDWGKLSEALTDYTQVPISFFFDTRYIEDICNEATKRAEQGGCDMLVVDYVQLLRTRRRFEQDRLRVGYISKCLKALSLELKIPVVALAQVSRQAVNRCPQLSDLRDSGDLEQDADNVIMLHRPDDASDPYIADENREMFRTFCRSDSEWQYIVMNVAKQRQGSVGVCAAIFDPSKMIYGSIRRKPART